MRTHLVTFGVSFTPRWVRLCLASQCRAFDTSHLWTRHPN